MSSGKKREIADWETLVEDDESVHLMNTSAARLEEMTVTELKHQMIKLMQSQAEQSRKVVSMETALTNKLLAMSRSNIEDTPRRLHSMTWTMDKEATSIRIAIAALLSVLPRSFISTVFAVITGLFNL